MDKFVEEGWLLRTHSVQLLHLQKRGPDGAVPNMTRFQL